MVEAPGTAPGSETLMSRGVYRHSRLPDTTNIGAPVGFLKASPLCHCMALLSHKGAIDGPREIGQVHPRLRAGGRRRDLDGGRLEHHASFQSRLAPACALSRRAV